MRRLIAVVTCDQRIYPQHDQGGHKNGSGRSDAIRATWYKDWLCRYADQIDLKFFFGRCDRTPLENEIILDAPDDYYGLPEKVRKMNLWATRAGYDHILKIDDDVYLNIARLLKHFDPVDYRGYLCEADIRYASGTAYWLSHRAAKIVAESPLDGDWAEDKFVGRTLARNGVELTNDERFLCCSCDVCMKKYDKDSLISIHLPETGQMETYYVNFNRNPGSPDYDRPYCGTRSGI